MVATATQMCPGGSSTTVPPSRIVIPRLICGSVHQLGHINVKSTVSTVVSELGTMQQISLSAPFSPLAISGTEPHGHWSLPRSATILTPNSQLQDLIVGGLDSFIEYALVNNLKP